MHLAYFTERPYRYAPQDQLIEKGFFGTPNRVFDPAKGHELYHEMNRTAPCFWLQHPVIPRLRVVMETLRPGVFILC